MAALPCLRCQLTALCQPTAPTAPTLRAACPPQLEDKAGNAAFTLRKLYEKLLRPFDEHSQERAEGGYGLLGG